MRDYFVELEIRVTTTPHEQDSTVEPSVGTTMMPETVRFEDVAVFKRKPLSIQVAFDDGEPVTFRIPSDGFQDK